MLLAPRKSRLRQCHFGIIKFLRYYYNMYVPRTYRIRPSAFIRFLCKDIGSPMKGVILAMVF